MKLGQDIWNYILGIEGSARKEGLRRIWTSSNIYEIWEATVVEMRREMAPYYARQS